MIKKNITINFCGRLYNIDEDAYEMLMHYTETLRRFYKKEGTEEVADDIEMRIAELLDEQIASGQNAVTIEMTKLVIDQLGNLDELAPGEEQDRSGSQHEGTSSTDSKHPRKGLYRDIENSVICGVLSGFSRYFGGSLHVWRVVMTAILFAPLLISICGGVVNYHLFIPMLFSVGFFNFTPIAIYILCALIMPKAIEPEDRLKMRGEEVNPQNIASEINRLPEIKTEGFFHRLFSALFRLFSGVMGIVYVVALFFAIGLFVVFVKNYDSETVMRIFGVIVNEDFGDYSRVAFVESKWYFVIFWISVFALLISLIYCCLHVVTRGFRKHQSMSGLQVMSWFVCIPMLIGLIIFSVISVRDIYLSHYKEYETKYRIDHTHEGYVFSDEEWDFYQKNGWKLLKAENLTDERYTYSGEYYDGDPSVRYVDAYSYNRNLIFQAEQTENVEPGTYTLSFYGRASEGGEGAFGYVQVVAEGSDSVLYLKEIPGYGNMLEINNLPHGWVKLTIDDIIVPKGATVRYGVSTDKAFTGKYCNVEYFSVTDYMLEKK